MLKKFPLLNDRLATEIFLFECWHERLECDAVAFDNFDFANNMAHEYLRGTYTKSSSDNNGGLVYYKEERPIASLRKILVLGDARK